jgi:hypothetical protein
MLRYDNIIDKVFEITFIDIANPENTNKLWHFIFIDIIKEVY